MHILTTESQMPIGEGLALEPGSYLMDDVDAARMMAERGGGSCRLSYFAPADILLSPYGPEHVITIVRPGRYGDLILLTPCLREIKRRWPTCTLQVACLPNYREALMGLPYIDNFVPYPLPMGEAVYGTILSLEVLASLVKREAELHITDLFAERLGLDSIDNKKPDFILSMDETAWAHDAYPRTKQKRVVVQIKSSTPSRDYPQIQMGQVLRMLAGRKWDVLCIGLPHQIEGKSENITNCAADRLTFRQSAAVVSTADVFLGPDSSMIHVAGALGIPAVGLFSVVPWNLRTTYCPTTFVIQAKNGCKIAPCFHAPRGAMGFPQNGPCIKDRFCSALATIDAHTVVGKVEQSVRD